MMPRTSTSVCAEQDLAANHHANLPNTGTPLQASALTAVRSSKVASPATRLGVTFAHRTTSSIRSFLMRWGLLGNVCLHPAPRGTASLTIKINALKLP
jgi:hypothetical protein